MTDLSETLGLLAAARHADPLSPVTVIVPSHAAALQQRRRLGRLGPFASVRFEMMSRLAELIAGGSLAAAGRRPLARPIGDYAAREVALTAGPPFDRVCGLPGFARVLRQVFLRLRRGGIRTGTEVTAEPGSALAETLRLYAAFRVRTAAFYDPEDLLDAAAEEMRTDARHRAALGDVYIAPPGPTTAAGLALAAALAPAVHIDDTAMTGAVVHEAFVLAPDPASEVREVARTVLALLADGAALDEVAVFHGSDRAYHGLLLEAFAAAELPAASVPGTPLAQSSAGRAALLIAAIPASDYGRGEVMALLGSATLPRTLAVEGGGLLVRATAWDRVSRAAGITGGAEAWPHALQALANDAREQALHQANDDGARQRAFDRQADDADELSRAVAALVALLAPLGPDQPAAAFIARFDAAFSALVHHTATGFDEVLREIHQLGTVDALGGTFSLASFEAALRANLETAAMRQGALSEGIFVAPYHLAAGLEFPHVILCGAVEGQFPARPAVEPLLGDETWLELAHQFPALEHAEARRAAGSEAAGRALAAATRTLTWTSPLHDGGGVHELYPCSAMAERAARHDPAVTSARHLRAHAPAAWLHRPPSPLAAAMHGTPCDRPEAGLRAAVAMVRAGLHPEPGHARFAATQLLRARRDGGFGPFDGNLRGLAPGERPAIRRKLSPTSLEKYGECGYRYFLASSLRLRPADTPEERETLGAADRGTLVHRALERFFTEQARIGRPGVRERWTPTDRDRLLEIAGEELEFARKHGLTGLDVFLEHERRTILYDLEQFIEEDNTFRARTGARPVLFEHPVPPVEVAGFTFTGIVDRIDRDESGHAYVIDYKTGKTIELKTDDPLVGGTKLQLPAYARAAQAEQVTSAYWFITTKNAFKQVPYDDTPANQQRFQATLEAIVGGIEAGAFPAVPGDPNAYFNSWEACQYCEFTRICARSRADTQDGRLAHDDAVAWKAVAAAAQGVAQ